ncbi:hypothetical protein HDU90_000074 [Geranomyces variabilis]|nr:hypothetical protein HDU90_000074 [Geranomyces variabilis]
MSSDAENNHPVWEDLRRYAGGSMWKDAFLAAIDGAEESVNDARRAKAALEAESAGFFNMAQAAMDAAAACGPSPGFLRGLCGDVCAILQADPLRKTLLLEGHFLAFLPATLAARIVAKCCSEKALRAMEMAYYTATLDVSNLPQVKRVDTSPVVYLHSARARSIDGPNALPTSTNLVYVGSALGHQGAVKRVFSNHLRKSWRRNNPSTHYKSFYGSTNEGTVACNPAGPQPHETEFYVVARMPKDLAVHRAIGVYVETVAAVAFGALTHHDGYCQARENAGLDVHPFVPWTGTNSVVPIAGFGSSQLSGHRGGTTHSRRLRSAQLEMVLSEDGYELPLMHVTKTGRRPDNPAHQLQAFLRHAMGQCAIGIATGAWNANPSLPSVHAREPKDRVEIGKLVLRMRARSISLRWTAGASRRRAPS